MDRQNEHLEIMKEMISLYYKIINFQILEQNQEKVKFIHLDSKFEKSTVINTFCVSPTKILL